MLIKSKLSFLLILVILFSVFAKLSAQNENDSLKNYWLKPVEIEAKRVNLGDLSNKISKDNLENILGKNGFTLIRKGVFFAQDIYADGLKRGDINVVIDGERYHSACPNRMDSPLTRINPLEIESVDLSKNSGHLQSGLGGSVQFNRSLPSDNINVSTELSALAGAQSGIDFAVLGDYAKHRLTLRFAQGSPYEDGDQNTFENNYNYKKNYDFKLAEGSFRGSTGDFSYGSSFSYTENISFPYLLMDERFNRVFSSHLRYGQHKLYFNYTDHMMDNDMRNNMMIMRTSVTNFTLGAIGNFYEVVYRNWNANNFFRNPSMLLQNDLMPDVKAYMASVFKSYDISSFKLHSKLGLEYKTVGETERKEFYEKVYNDVDLDRLFPIFSFGVSYLKALSNSIGSGIMMELNSESPETESLFIAVNKPGGKPAWSGNPSLKQPVKFGLRSLLTYRELSVEIFASHIWNYNNLSKRTVNTTNFLTFSNIDARMYGGNLFYNHPNIDFNLSYVWAKNQTNDTPLSEIPPLSVKTKVISPEYNNFVVYARHTYNNAQTRIDDNLNERTSSAWNKIDLGISYTWSNLNISLDIENILNSNYYQHLSFLRDPFMANNQVYEPGRVFRITFKTNRLL